MHNGDVADFKRIRRSLLAHLRDDLFDQISGTTDSELVFSLILNELPDVYDKYEPKVLEKAVFKAICIIIKANRGQANSINMRSPTAKPSSPRAIATQPPRNRRVSTFISDRCQGRRRGT